MLQVVGERRINRYSIVVGNALQRDRHLKARQAVFSPNGFFERLSSFWSDHFSINTLKSTAVRILAALYEAEAIRPHLAGRFSDLPRAFVLHPTMLDYLDQIRSMGPSSPVGLKSGRADLAFTEDEQAFFVRLYRNDPAFAMVPREARETETDMFSDRIRADEEKRSAGIPPSRNWRRPCFTSSSAYPRTIWKPRSFPGWASTSGPPICAASYSSMSNARKIQLSW
ncbi:DUF1800 domain-containing protein [Shinella sp. CPCC 101442]|uniref:DUF1800 domain-containing protein n=1 Tax=Shinella sp. CPCC 101442 TaxID=2932265 RepID=UPI0021521FB4|nr:DUF1800 domain-containing protein [Shinella sp. CPCC 101442]MCR6499718.1 DUF1800 domain-containing protein [Shinella sp. CPCC 101442]